LGLVVDTSGSRERLRRGRDGGVTNEVILAVVIGGRVVEVVPGVGGRTVEGGRRALLGIGRGVLLNLGGDDGGCVSVWCCRPTIAIAEDTKILMGADRSRDGKIGRRKGAVSHAEGTASVDGRKFAKWRYGALMIIVNVGTGTWHET
jgi:hypothetical protein